MAKTYLTNINLKGNQLLNAAIQPSASAPSALTAGQLYYNTADGIFYFSTGTGTGNWSPVGVQYIKSVGSNLSVDGSGALSISSDPSFNTIHLTQDGQGENILVGNDAYIGDINVPNFIGIKGNEDATKGGIKFGSAKTESVSTDGNNLTISADNDIVLLPGSNYAYLGTPLIDGSNRIATLGDVSQGAIQAIDGTTDQISVSKIGETVTISLPSYINIDNGELHLQKTEYWRDGTQQGVIAAQSDGSLRLTGTNNGLQLESNNGNIKLTPPEISRVILDGNTDVNNGLRVSNELTVGGWDNVDGLVSVQNADGVNMLVVDTAASPNNGYHGYNTYTNATGVVNLNAVLNISSEGNVPSGYLFMNVYGASTNPTLHLESKGDLALRAGADGNDGNIILYTGQTSSGQPGKAYIGWNHDNGGNYNNQIATIGDVSTAQSNAEGYADTAASNALNSANSYTDAAISSEVSRANSAYDPAGSASSAQTAAQSYADTAATNAENSAKSYADSLASNYDPAGSATTAENNAKSYTDTKVADLVGMAPSLLDTLEKIDNAIANDANFSTTLLTDIASAQATAESYTDSAIATEITNRNSAIATAKSEAITEAEGYTDTQLSAFGNQASTDISNAITTAENYADNLVTSLALTSKYVGSISGDGATDTFTITHNLGKRSVMVQVYQSSGSPDTQWADVEVDITRISTNAITIGMGVPPTIGTTYEVVIVG